MTFQNQVFAERERLTFPILNELSIINGQIKIRLSMCLTDIGKNIKWSHLKSQETIFWRSLRYLTIFFIALIFLY